MSWISEVCSFSITGNAGGAVTPVTDNINIIGSGSLVVTGDPVLGTLTISGGGVTGMTQHALAVGTAGGSITSLTLGTTGTVLTGVTGADPAFSASPTLTAVYATTFDTNVAAAGVTLAGTSLIADGTDADIDINITAKGAGQVIIDDLQLTTDLAVTEGGTGVSTLTDHGLLVGSGAAAIDALSVGATGTILTGVTGADPTWTTATYPSTAAIGDVLVASAANTIGVVTGAATAGHVLTANGAGSAPTFQALPAPVVGSFASDAETIAGTVTNKAVAPSNLKAKLGLQTVHALPVGNSDSLALGWLAVGTDGTVLVGNTAADPSFSANPTLTTVYATTFDTNVAAAAVTLSGTTLSADGTDADININITAKGSGQVIIDDLQLTTDLAVTEGGTGASTLLDHGLLVGSGTAAVDALAVGTTGTILTGVTGADPTWTTATYPATVTLGDVLVASADNVVGVVSDVVNAGYVLTANAAAAPTFQALPPTSVTLTADDANTASGAAITMTGGTNIGTTANGASTFTINLDDAITLTTVNATTFDTNVAAAAVTLSGTTLSADGTDADININITAKGAGQVIIDDLQLTTDLAVTEGGTGVSTLTDHGLLVGSGAAAIDALSVGATGTILTGVTGADPSWTTATYPATAAIGDVLVASAANTIGVVTGAATAGHVLMANGAGSAPTFQALPASVASVSGTANQITASTVGSDVTLSTPATFIAPGTIAATTTVTAGTDLISTAGNLLLPTTSSTVGQIIMNGERWLHSYGSYNVFLGYRSGNLATVTGTNNVCIGKGTGLNLSSGVGNLLYGGDSGYYITTGSYNVSIGNAALYYSRSGHSNVAIGAVAGCRIASATTFTGSYNVTIGPCTDPTGSAVTGTGTNYTSSESSNILISNAGTVGESNKIHIGTSGSGVGQQDATYIAGCYGVTPAGTINVALVDSNGQFGSVASLGVAQGGTGTATLTDHGILLGSGTGAITPLGVATDGQLPIGSTGADPVLATITAGTGISVTNGAGSITIASTVSALAWSEITDATKTIVNQEAYVANRGTQIVFTLPASAALGTEFKIQGKNSGLFRIAQNAGQTIHFGATDTTTGAGGYVESLNTYDGIGLVCITADTDWAVTSSIGNFTIA